MQAQELGLDDALRAANSHLKTRRSALVREIHMARKGANMDALQSLRGHALALDMPDVLLSVDSTLESHAAVAKQKLQAAAVACTSSPLFASHVQVRLSVLCCVQVLNLSGHDCHASCLSWLHFIAALHSLLLTQKSVYIMGYVKLVVA